jgi:cytochrome c oxidase assembly protein subunit 15
VGLGIRGRRFAASRTASTLALVMVVIQFGLGITVLLSGVPVNLGAMHQGGAVILLGSLVWTSHRLS